MLNSSVLNDTLKDFNYYLSKVPMFLQQSESFIEHFRIWYDLLVGKKDEINNTGVVGVADTLFNLLNIFYKSDDDSSIENQYLAYLITIEDAWDENATEQDKQIHKYGTKSDILDKIGALFGVTRSFDVSYVNPQNETVNVHLSLDNMDFLILIKTQIIKNYCDGSYDQISKYYESVGLNICSITSSEPATVNMYLIKYDDATSEYYSSENVRHMFFAELLTIKSMGIKYRHEFVDMTRILVWDRETEDFGWGEDIEYQGETITTGGQWLV